MGSWLCADPEAQVKPVLLMPKLPTDHTLTHPPGTQTFSISAKQVIDPAPTLKRCLAVSAALELERVINLAGGAVATRKQGVSLGRRWSNLSICLI
jgi:hypothetical protein